MKYEVVVTFGKGIKEYAYQTNLNLIIGAKYDIIADNITKYQTPVIVKRINPLKKSRYCEDLRTITQAKLLEAPRVISRIKRVQFNEEKGVTTVIWCDGEVTMVRCAAEDAFDKEKAIAMCALKRLYNNRACFNYELKKWCEEE